MPFNNPRGVSVWQPVLLFSESIDRKSTKKRTGQVIPTPTKHREALRKRIGNRVFFRQHVVLGGDGILVLLLVAPLGRAGFLGHFSLSNES
jgi:hypothetical protein